MKVYTKTGDRGTTSLVGGKRVCKDNIRIEAYGTVDELMSHIAHLRDNMYGGEVEWEACRADLLTVLDHLMRMSSHLAAEGEVSKRLPVFTGEYISFLESRIDDMESTFPPVDKFTLPGGHPLISLCHIARTVCRRSEIRICALDAQCAVDENIMGYINRLSDYLYVLGRKLAYELNVKELLWEYEK